MRFWTAHLHEDDIPLLIPEGFSVAAALFGPIWLAAHRAWIPALLLLAAMVTIAIFVPTLLLAVLAPACVTLLGLCGRDLVRWSIGRRGYYLAHVLAARSEAEALGRLLAHRPHLSERFLPKDIA